MRPRRRPYPLAIAFAALAALLIGADPCLLGAVGGSTTMACLVRPAAQAAPHCHGPAATKPAPCAGHTAAPGSDGSCCRIQPSVPGNTPAAIALPPQPASRLAAAVVAEIAAPAPASPAWLAAAFDRDVGPPASRATAPRGSRAPPLS